MNPCAKFENLSGTNEFRKIAVPIKCILCVLHNLRLNIHVVGLWLEVHIQHCRCLKHYFQDFLNSMKDELHRLTDEEGQKHYDLGLYVLKFCEKNVADLLYFSEFEVLFLLQNWHLILISRRWKLAELTIYDYNVFQYTC